MCTSTRSCTITPATPVIYTLSLHDALPIYNNIRLAFDFFNRGCLVPLGLNNLAHLFDELFAPLGSPSEHHDPFDPARDRKSTRLNSSHGYISYDVFCSKEKTMILPHAAHVG